jgi:membrane-associated HD superfamily phosphohydrolase
LQKEKHQKLLWIIIAIIVVLLVGGGGTGYYFYHQHQAVVEKAKERAALIKKEKKYDEKFRTTLADISSAYNTAKPITQKYIDKWTYFLANGTYWNDEENMPELVLDVDNVFQFTKKELESDIDSLTAYNNSVEKDMSSLGTPPKKFKSVSDRLNNLYGDYQTLYELANSPDSEDALTNYKNQQEQLTSSIGSELNQINASIPIISKK